MEISKSACIYSAIAIVVAIVASLSIGNIIALFSVSMLIAYMIKPVMQPLDRLFFGKRSISALTIVCIIFVTLLIIIVVGLPKLVAQLIYIATLVSEQAPMLIARAKDLLPNYLEIEILQRLSNIANSFVLFIINGLSAMAAQITTIVSFLVISPIIVYYALRDWNLIMPKMLPCIPQEHRNFFAKLIHTVDIVLTAYLRGQTKVCISLAIFYAISFSIIGLNYAIIISIAIGIISYVPYLGSVFAFASGITMGLIQFEDVHKILVIIAIVVTAQLIDNMFLTPHLVGSAVKLHPIEVIASILIANELFGFIGLVASTPLAAIIKRFIINASTSRREQHAT